MTSKPTRPVRGARKKERGVALTAVVITSAALFAAAAVGVDTGRLALTANEVQTVADIAATAGAQALLEGGNASTARNHAQTVVATNFVDGAAATIDPAQIEVGQYNPQTGTFTPGALPASAVRATPAATVQNLFVGIFGSSYATSTVTKTATAAFSGLGEAAATLPLAIGACHFPALTSCFAASDCLPRLSQVPSTSDNTGWTSFLNGPTDGNTVGDYLPGACGGKKTPPTIKVGDALHLNNGQVTSLLKDVEDCVEKKGFTEFLVPVVGCDGNFNQTATVTGFAKIIVESVESQGNPKGLTLHAIFEETAGTPGGGAYGHGMMRLFN